MAEKYRLQALLIIKERVKKQAELYLSRTIAQLKEENETLKKLNQEKEDIIKKWEEARDEMSVEMAAGGTVSDGNVHSNWLRALKEDEETKQEEIEGQEVVVEEAENSVKEARVEYIEACKALQIMEKHKELWAKKIRDELTRKEEKELDELGQNIHELRRWKGKKSDFAID
ncbi:hypothetical protein KKA47_04760 [bacterium]|nr:hypothetical protein [bacterium]